MGLLKRIWQVMRADAALLRAHPRLAVAVLAVVLVPSLYAFIYLDSVWDPASRTGALPAAIVNLDTGTVVGGTPVNIGQDLVATLRERRAFGFYDVADAEAARRDVRAGRSLFALIIPADFSASAMAAAAPGAGKLVVFASEGNNYAGAGFAKRFATELGHQLNETLNERRWAAVLGNTAQSADTLQRLRDATARLREGAVALESGVGKAQAAAGQLGEGAGRLNASVVLLADGVRQLGAGARALDAARPPACELQALKDGASRLAAGHGELQGGMRALGDGAGQLVTGIGRYREEATDIPFFGERLAEGLGPVGEGAAQLQAGIRSAAGAQAQLGEGAQQLARGVQRTADGFASHGAGVATLAARFPADRQLDELAGGARALADGVLQYQNGLAPLKAGANQLAAGMDTLARSLPPGVSGPPGTARGLAASVQPQLEIDAPVRNNGMGFLPNFVPVALWLGAVATSFIFHLRRVPQGLAGHGRVALLAGKLLPLWAITVVQALCVLLMCALLLGLQPVHAAGLALCMVVSSLTFMAVILMLVRGLGDAGKGLALLLLVVQLSAAGGVMPIELTNDFYAAISPWLPFTWSVRAVRASAFGAFGHEWGAALAVLGLFAAAALLLTLLVGRWVFVPPQEHRPAVDF